MDIIQLISCVLVCVTSVTGLDCYSCLDVTVLETDRQPNSTVPSLYQKIVDFDFYGQDPSSCESPALIQCPAGESCISIQTVVQGVYAGIRGKADAILSNCVDLSNPGYENTPKSGCVDNEDAFDLATWAILLDSTFIAQKGVACICNESACNDPRDHRGLYCYSCLDVTILEKDRNITGSIVPLYDALVAIKFSGVNPPACDSPSLVKCSDHETCFTVLSEVEGTYSGINGKAEVVESLCLDRTLDGYENVPEIGCIDNAIAYDLDKWGSYLNSTLDKATGVSCACNEPACNDLQDHRGLYCYSCLDVTILEKDRNITGSILPLYDALVASKFSGVNPPACDSPSLVKCSDHETCFTVLGEVEGTYSGINGKVEVMESVCLDRTRDGYENVPRVGCIDNAISYDLDKWGYLNSSLDKVTGESCACDDSACNDPREHRALYCYSCFDVNILESDRRENMSVVPLHDKLVQVSFGGTDPGSCTSPSLVKCQEDDRSCLVMQADIDGIYRGIHGKVDLVLARCTDITTPGHSLLPPSGCVENTKGYDLDEWGVYLQSTFTDISGAVCMCDSSTCNHPREHMGLYCYTCMDVSIIESDRKSGSSVPSLYDKLMFGGKRPVSCDSPALVKCSAGETCYTNKAVFTGTNGGIREKASLLHSQCLETNTAGHLKVLQPGCVDVAEAFDPVEWGRYLGVTFSGMAGTVCTCNGTGCNDPPDILESLRCSHCREIEVNFGRSETNRVIEADLLMKVFGADTPWCPYAGDINCEPGEYCTSLEVSIQANYEEDAGSLKITHHNCMSLSKMAEIMPLGMDVSNKCIRVSETILFQMYGNILEPFKNIELEGELCLCHKALCNLPTKQDEKPSSSCAGCAMYTYFPFVLTIISFFQFLK